MMAKQQGPELPTITTTWHASKYKADQIHWGHSQTCNAKTVQVLERCNRINETVQKCTKTPFCELTCKHRMQCKVPQQLYPANTKTDCHQGKFLGMQRLGTHFTHGNLCFLGIFLRIKALWHAKKYAHRYITKNSNLCFDL